MRVFVCATFLIVRIAFAAEPAPPSSPFVLLDASKSLAWDDIREGSAALFLSNQTDKPRTAIASLTPFQPDTGVGAPLNWRQRRVALAIPAHDIARIPLLPASAPTAAGGHSGFLVVEETGQKSSPLIQPIRITATGAQPAVSKLTQTLTRLIPFTRAYWRTRIPIPFTSGPMPRLAAAALTNDSGGWTRVHWRGEAGKEQDFEADPPDHSGTYHGDLAFAAGAEKTTVALTLLTRDLVLWPIVVIAIGTWFAYLVKRFLGLRRITLDLREQEAKLGEGFRRAQARFVTITAGKPYGAYDIARCRRKAPRRAEQPRQAGRVARNCSRR